MDADGRGTADERRGTQMGWMGGEPRMNAEERRWGGQKNFRLSKDENYKFRKDKNFLKILEMVNNF